MHRHQRVPADLLGLLPKNLAGRIHPGISLEPFTTLRVGGPADLYVEARNGSELEALAVAAKIASFSLPVVLKIDCL